ncbi:MAG: hypothetical protein U0176_00395 [Bacteroidia bacterium]
MRQNYFSLILLGLLLFAVGCKDKTVSTATPTNDTVAVADTTPPAEPDSVALIRLAQEILNLSAQAKYAELVPYIHPTEGIRFSPYTYVDTKEHKHFTATEFKDQVETHGKDKVLWGTSDPMGEPIKLTVANYFQEFAHSKDYVGGKLAFNETIGGGTTINNIAEVYPGALFVEAYWAPADEEKAPSNGDPPGLCSGSMRASSTSSPG